MEAFAIRAAHRCIAGSPARQRGNFSLLRQRRVTKREALNRTPAPQARSAQGNKQPSSAKTRPAALSRLSLSPAPSIAPSARFTRGCTPCSPEQPHAASLGRRDPCAPPTGASLQRRGIADESCVQPTLTGVKVRSWVLVTGTAARAQRVAFLANDVRHLSRIAAAPWCSCAVQRRFFGDFLLAQQKKVTRPPGRTPGTALADKQALH